MWEVLWDTFSSKWFSKLNNFSPFTHTRPMSDLEFIFCFHKLLGTQIFMSSQVIGIWIVEFWRSLEQESRCIYLSSSTALADVCGILECMYWQIYIWLSCCMMLCNSDICKNYVIVMWCIIFCSVPLWDSDVVILSFYLSISISFFSCWWYVFLW